MGFSSQRFQPISFARERRGCYGGALARGRLAHASSAIAESSRGRGGMSLIGSLDDLGLGDILQIINLSQKSGVLIVVGDQGEGRIVFRDGLVRGAARKGGRSCSWAPRA